MTQPPQSRRSLRLRDYDYAASGAYFVTVCTQHRVCLFGDVVNNTVWLNEYGDIVLACWDDIPAHFTHVDLDAFVVMPNHVHGIIVLTDRMQTTPFIHVPPVSPGAQHAAPFPVSRTPRPHVQPGSLGAIVRAFKSAVTQRINALRRGGTGAACCAPTSTSTILTSSASPIWQRNYYEHVIRNEAALHRLREYIQNNPAAWADDAENPRRRFAPAQEKP